MPGVDNPCGRGQPETLPATAQTGTPTGPPGGRLLLIDALKGFAAQLILLHHLVSYGPLAAAAHRMWPGLSLWVYEYGRMAVYVFLVVAGFLAARILAADRLPHAGHPLGLIWQRYMRLLPAFFISVLLAVAVAGLARLGLQDDMLPAAPTVPQLLSYLFLLHGLLGVPSLSVGVWYVPIDLQLYALWVAMLWLAGYSGAAYRRPLALILVALLAMASLFWFNRNPGLDNWGIYFFYAYALGILSWWLTRPERSLWWLGLLLVVVGVSLVHDFRLRVAIALLVALLLAMVQRHDWLQQGLDVALLRWLGRISFSVFLVHFPVFMAVNALHAQLDIGGDADALAAIVLAWGLSLVAGEFFYRHVESRRRWLPERLSAALGRLPIQRRR